MLDEAESERIEEGEARSGPAALEPGPIEGLHRTVVILLQIVMGVELVAAVTSGLWLTALIVVAVMSLTVTPLLFRERLPLRVPFGLQITAALFMFATLFLGEVRDFYERIWWWDMGLHFVSGLLLGIGGFMLVFILNGDAQAERSLRPNFMALFVFCFALGLGALWEVFEFLVDVTLGTQMQRPMMSDGTGLTDTMWDLILDAVGALVVALAARRWMVRGEPSVLDRWLERVARENPKLFPRRPPLGLPARFARRRAR